MKKNKIVLMYHSIESEEHPAVLGSFPISMKRFKRQILALQKRKYKFDFLSNFHQDIADDEMYIYITGDDGTVDWTRNILPWCEANKIPTHTGVITGPFEKESIYPLTHMIQIILSSRDERELSILSNRIQNEFLTKQELQYIHKIYHYEELEYRRIIKGAFNLIFDVNQSKELLGDLSAIEKQLLKQRFESLEYYKEFEYAEVGVHTKSHWALGGDIKEYIDTEIESSKELLLKNGLQLTGFYVSPMKPKNGYTLEDIKEPLHQLGYEAILDSNHGVWDGKSFIIPRIDAKNVEEFFNL